MLCTPIQAQKVFAHALKNNYALLAVNADSHGAVTDSLRAAKECNAPIIIETSLWQLEGHSYGAGNAVTGLSRYIADIAVLASSPEFADIPVILHTDHIKGPKTFDILKPAIQGIQVPFGKQQVPLRASTISLDASEFTSQENIDAICQLASFAQEADVPVTLEMEAEVDEGITDPDITRNLIGSVETKHPGAVFLYAPGLGTKHGFSDDGYPEFKVDVVADNIALLKEITGRDIGLALHGSSGLSEDDLTAAAKAGVVKVNCSTESLMIRSSSAQKFYAEHGAELEKKHPQWKVTAMDNGVQSFVSEAYIPRVVNRIKLLNGEGKAASLKEVL